MIILAHEMYTSVIRTIWMKTIEMPVTFPIICLLGDVVY